MNQPGVEGNTGTIEQSRDHQEIGRALITLIQSRRSIREGFTDQPIPDEVITDIIGSGLSAPSAKNAQPWRIHVVNSNPKLGEIADLVQTSKGADKYAPIDPTNGQPRRWSSTVALSSQLLRDVQVGFFIENTGSYSGGKQSLLVCENKETLYAALDGYCFESVGFGTMIENMWLTAHAHGLSGTFLADVVVAEEEINKMLGIDGDLIGVLALGYSEAQPWNKTLKDDAVRFH